MASTPAWRSAVRVRPASFIFHRQGLTCSPLKPFRVSSLNGEFVSPEYLINIEPQDEDPILMAMRQEGQQDGHKQPPRPEPQPEPELRRSARIKAKKQDAVPPKVKTPAKSTSRKRAVRKK